LSRGPITLRYSLRLLKNQHRAKFWFFGLIDTDFELLPRGTPGRRKTFSSLAESGVRHRFSLDRKGARSHTLSHMAQLSRSPEEWSESAVLSNRAVAKAGGASSPSGTKISTSSKATTLPVLKSQSKAGWSKDHPGQTRAWSGLVIDKAMTDWRSWTLCW
jgi:hypothetical protein